MKTQEDMVEDFGWDLDSALKNLKTLLIVMKALASAEFLNTVI